ncbi:MAG: 6-phospho-beta-glucosidase [Dermabacter sp.]|nr:6-phospho-beta-glucosidase [Dermabacter sp.]
MKLAILGGGGFRTPLVYQAVATGAGGLVDGFEVTEIALYDVDAQRLAAIEAVIRAYVDGHLTPASGAASPPRLSVTTDLVEAVSGADVVFSAIRVGGATGRILDERVALETGLLGQETIGAGGLAYALRTIPVMRRIAHVIAEHAPGAWVINFTNPAGIVTEAMQAVLGSRAVGICDTPIGLVARVARLLGVPGADVSTRVSCDYAGINHLGWLRGVRVDGTERLPEILASDAALQQIEEARLVGADWVRAEAAIPNEYLYYYLDARAAAERAGSAEQTRGEFLHAQQGRFYAEALGARDAYALWREVLREREATYMAEARADGEDREEADITAGGYHEVALRLMAALVSGREDRMILNVANRTGGAGGIAGLPVLAALPADMTIEVPCRMDAAGIHPEPVSPLPLEHLGLVARQRGAERHILAAALTGSREEAWLGFSTHPLISSPALGKVLLERYEAAHPQIAALFAEGAAPSARL